MTIQDDVNRILRDHEGYTGDGKGSVGALPIGDPATPVKPVSKRDLREAILAPLLSAAADAQRAEDAADRAEAAESSVSFPVSYAPNQGLTPTQKQDARDNIGVGAVDPIATLPEFAAATASRTYGTDSIWGNLAALTDAATITVDLNTGYDFGGSGNVKLALGGNRTLGSPSNGKTGQKGILWFGASGSTRTLTLHGDWKLADGVEEGPYSITTSDTLGVAYVCLGSTVVVTAIVRF